MTNSIILGHIIYVAVFGGCFAYLVRDLPFRFSRLLSLAVLTVILFFLYTPTDSTLVNTMLRYGRFFILFALWSFCALRIRKAYGLYLSGFYIIFMGVWFSCVQVLFSGLGLDSSTLLTAVTGLCRILSILFFKRFFVREDHDRTLTSHEMMISLFPAAACFVANLVLFDYLSTSGSSMTSDYRTLINVLVIFFGFSAMTVLVNSEHYFQVNRYKKENELARQQLHAQYRHFLKEQENNSRIKALHHDMQNHLHTLEALSGSERVQSYIQELQQNIRDLEPCFSTGNPTLDALLTAKKPECDQAGIELTCFIHLTAQDFLTPMEICTLFGNCIDNAIEAVSQEGISRPYIHLSGGEVNENLVIRIENPYAHPLQVKNNTFATTKADPALHGYGLMNIRRIVEQKSGVVTINTDNGKFVLTWLIPMSG